VSRPFECSSYLVNPPLTTREREVLQLAKAGLDALDARLGVRPSPYRDVVVDVIQKLGGTP